MCVYNLFYVLNLKKGVLIFFNLILVVMKCFLFKLEGNAMRQIFTLCMNCLLYTSWSTPPVMTVPASPSSTGYHKMRSGGPVQGLKARPPQP